MSRIHCCRSVILSVLAIFCLLSFNGCSPTNSEGFAIYLTSDDVSPSDMANLEHYELADQPVISSEDIIGYTAATHEISLLDTAYECISALEVPVSGKSFVVCVDKKPIYYGAFWTSVSSISFDGVVIQKPVTTNDSKIIKLETGYPDTSFYRGTDPRNNEKVMQALEKDGKLVSVLPSSFKGYELYSWQQNAQWHFTLITGTNRNKTTEEIIAPSNRVTQDGWVQIHVIGVEAIKAVLTRIPGEEWVAWLDGSKMFKEDSEIAFAYPRNDIIEEFKAISRQRGFNLSVIT